MLHVNGVAFWHFAISILPVFGYIIGVLLIVKLPFMPSLSSFANDQPNVSLNPATFQTLDDWLTYIHGIHMSAIDMGLSRVRPVADMLGITAWGNNRDGDSTNQQITAHVFMVAGTNGKGSTTATIAQICQQAGHKTALYQSPHLLKFNERVRIDGQSVSDEWLIDAFKRVEEARLACQVSLSFFEMTTLAALLIFADANCDVWVLEVGLGGRLDVVNLIDADVAVITNVGIDHVDWLGDNRESIGYEKAGILRQGMTLIYGEADMPASVAKQIEQLDVTVYQAGRDYGFYQHDADMGANKLTCGQQWQYSNPAITLNLPYPNLSLVNVTNAISAVLASGLSISDEHVRMAMPQVRMPGRFDLRHIGERQWLFDVAHNQEGINFLLEQLQQRLPSMVRTLPTVQTTDANKGQIRLLFSMLVDKDIDKVVTHLQQANLPIVKWYVGVINHARAASADTLQQVLSQHLASEHYHIYDDMASATQAVQADSTADELILVCGSFHTIAESLGYLGA